MGEYPCYEIIDGEAYQLAAPSGYHQSILTELLAQVYQFLKGKPGKVFPAPYAVRLFPRSDNRDDTVVEPDIVVVRDKAKRDARGCNGAPDMAVKILSPPTSRNDCFVKFNKYRAAGVREYWVVNPEDKTVQTHILENKRYVTSVYGAAASVAVSALPGCVVHLPEVFAEK